MLLTVKFGNVDRNLPLKLSESDYHKKGENTATMVIKEYCFFFLKNVFIFFSNNILFCYLPSSKEEMFSSLTSFSHSMSLSVGTTICYKGLKIIIMDKSAEMYVMRKCMVWTTGQQQKCQ